MITLDPVAYFYSDSEEKADSPRQGALSSQIGFIRFLPRNNFEQALEDLEGIEKIWVLFWMDRVCHFKPKIQPPREVKKKGVFATRSPHRPNPIGLSCVTLLSVSDLELKIQDHDLLDKTPILDIKPYLPYADSFPLAKTGWIDGKPPSNEIKWSDLSLKQIQYLKEKKVDLRKKIESRLQFFTFPSSSNRICSLEGSYYLAAYKTWRILFQKEDVEVRVLSIFSGYDLETLQGVKTSFWEDVLLHQSFIQMFFPFFSETFVGKGWILYSAFNHKKEGVRWEVFLKEGL